jgi:YrbI family 3-deoxy-D-manno-octulosonate 8-phosphate phosphatase
MMRNLANAEMVFFDFDGVFTDNRVLVSEDGKEAVFCYRSDGIGLSKLTKVGVDCMVVSSEPNPVVSIRCQKLNIDCIQGVQDKLSIIKKILVEKGINPRDCVFVGNDDGDFEAMAYVGIPVAVADAYPHIKEIAEIVLSRKGGRGAIREICELIVRAKLNHA